MICQPKVLIFCLLTSSVDVPFGAHAAGSLGGHSLAKHSVKKESLLVHGSERPHTTNAHTRRGGKQRRQSPNFGGSGLKPWLHRRPPRGHFQSLWVTAGSTGPSSLRAQGCCLNKKNQSLFLSPSPAARNVKKKAQRKRCRRHCTCTKLRIGCS